VTRLARVRRASGYVRTYLSEKVQGAGEPMDFEAISPWMSCRVSHSGPLNIDKTRRGLNLLIVIHRFLKIHEPC
jgi:hypothetical protein